MEENVKFYRVRRDLGWEYYAAESEQALLGHLEDPKKSNSLASIFKYELDTLREITKEQATRAPCYTLFTKKCIIRRDGTWLLGVVSPETWE